jgi:two-component system nitrogen regulation sensor histidine kinase NtrY
MTSADTSAASLDPSFAEPKGWSLRRLLAPFAVGLALLSAFLTFVVLTGLTPIEPTREVVVSFLLINGATILVLVGIIVREVWQMIQAGAAGRRRACTSRSSVCFPSWRVAGRWWRLSPSTIDRGLIGCFRPTREVIQNSLIVANAYLHEHAQLIRGDILGMANDIAHARPLFDQDRATFRELLTASAASRNLPGAMLIDKDRNILETAQTGIQQSFTTPAPEFLSNVDENEPQIAVFIEANYVAAVIRLRAFNDTFLYVARLLDPRVVAQLRQTQASVAEYAQLEARRLGIQWPSR